MHWYAKELKFQHGQQAEWSREIVLCCARLSVVSAKQRASRKLKGKVIEIRQERQGKTLQKHRRAFHGAWQQVPTVKETTTTDDE